MKQQICETNVSTRRVNASFESRERFEGREPLCKLVLFVFKFDHRALSSRASATGICEQVEVQKSRIRHQRGYKSPAREAGYWCRATHKMFSNFESILRGPRSGSRGN